MKADSIFEKARALGLDTGSSVNQIENLRTIAKQLGVEDLGEIEEALDSMLQSNVEDDILDTPDVEQIDENIEEPELHHREDFGEREYNDAKNDEGAYDKDYYANRQRELDQQVEDAKNERNNPYKNLEDNDSENPNNTSQNNRSTSTNKETEANDTETSSYVPKSKWDRARDNINLANAQKESAYNKINNAKSKIYQATHPGEMLKEKAKSAASDAAQAAGEAAKEVGKKAAQATGKAAASAGKAVGSAAASGAKAIVSFFASNPIALVILIVIVLVILVLVFLFNGYYEVEEEGYYEGDDAEGGNRFQGACRGILPACKRHRGLQICRHGGKGIKDKCLGALTKWQERRDLFCYLSSNWDLSVCSHKPIL